ncbi:MAG: transcription elongation factor GreA [Clostridia bacterium]|nr:transcription elongation factor GreA [Clostridia bacterium]MDD4571312.1 transcription elongation factor GreA [Clostridia bacterium]
MADKETLLTVEGLKKMEKELENLKTVRRKEVAERIRQAIEFGDISENSEYEDAKNEQAFIEGNIMDLEKKLRNARVIDTVGLDGQVSVGSTVTLLNLDTNKERVFTIVGTSESDPSKNKISNESPIGKGILGMREGETKEIAVPIGMVRLKVLAISRN